VVGAEGGASRRSSRDPPPTLHTPRLFRPSPSSARTHRARSREARGRQGGGLVPKGMETLPGFPISMKGAEGGNLFPRFLFVARWKTGDHHDQGARQECGTSDGALISRGRSDSLRTIRYGEPDARPHTSKLETERSALLQKLAATSDMRRGSITECYRRRCVKPSCACVAATIQDTDPITPSPPKWTARPRPCSFGQVRCSRKWSARFATYPGLPVHLRQVARHQRNPSATPGRSKQRDRKKNGARRCSGSRARSSPKSKP